MFPRLRALFRSRERQRQLEAELDEEIQFHLEQEAARNRRAGMDEAAARTAALRSFGGVAQTREQVREARGVRWLEPLGQDLRFGLRTMGKHPAWSAVVVLTLAIGVGANTTMFSLVDGVLLRPLPYPRSGELVRIDELRKGAPVAVSQRGFVAWQAQPDLFAAVGIYFRSGFTLAGDGGALPLDSARMSAGAFAALGVPAALGRTFAPDDERPGAPPVVVLDHRLWRERFAGDPSILNRPIAPGGPVVVGVMPPGFAFPVAVSLWEPLEAWRAQPRNRTGRLGTAIARLRPGVGVEQARVALETIARRLEPQFPDTHAGGGVRVQPLLDSQVGDVRLALWILLGAAGLVLLIACANVAGLLLARAVAREGEMAVRAALGAGSRRLARQVLTECVLLAVTGSLAGVLLAACSLRLVVWLGQGRIPRLAGVGLDGRVLAFSVVVALLTGVGFGLAPALHARRRGLASAIRSAGDRVAGGGRAGRVLVVAQVTLTLVLLVGAGLLLRSFRQLVAVDPGFSLGERLTFRLGLPESRYGVQQQLAFFERWLARLRALPGVTSASLASEIPLDIDDASLANRLGQPGTRFILEDRPEPPPQDLPFLELRAVDPDYFRVMGIPLLRGRGFSDRDDRGHLRGGPREDDRLAAMNVVIVDAESARRHWPGQDPIGKRIRLPLGPRERNPVVTVVGVVGRVKLVSLREQGGPLQAYIPFRQAIAPADATLVLHSRSAREPLLAAVRRLAAELAPDQPLRRIGTFSELRDKHLAPDRLTFLLVAAFGAVALLLAVVGLYGALAYAVAQRRREIAVRVALGAHAGQIARLVLRQGLGLAAAGTALGLGGALLLTRTLAALLHGVKPGDPATLAAVTALMLLVALAASLLPARQAARTDPMAALRKA